MEVQKILQNYYLFFHDKEQILYSAKIINIDWIYIMYKKCVSCYKPPFPYEIPMF